MKLNMRYRDWLRPPRVVLTVFLCLMCSCAGTLAWLAYKVVEQDRVAEAQRIQERLESAADRIVAALDRSLQQAGDFADVRKPGPGEVFVTVSGGSVEILPPAGLAFSPLQPIEMTSGPDVFREAEEREFGQPDLEKAEQTYRGLATSKMAQVRAGALLRLGRVLRRQQRWPEALKTYDDLGKMGSFSLAGMPVNLVARAARCSVLEEGGQSQMLRREADALWADLAGGRLVVSRPTLDTYSDELRRWIGSLPTPPDWDERLAVAEAASAAWQAWQADEKGVASGRRFDLFEGSPVSVCWLSRGSVWQARLAGPSFWRRFWESLGHDSGAAMRLTGEHGEAFFGTSPPKGPTALRAAAMTGLPWNVIVTPEGDWARLTAFGTRRHLIAAGFVVFALLLTAGSYFIARSMVRELAVARLQSDFVDAVSHEFRTPLTSIRQLAEMLARGRVDFEEQKQRVYELMMAESDRLRRLVESLLDFGRMQSGAYQFRLESLDAEEWARAVVEQFGETVRNAGYAVEFAGAADGACIRADREALSGALWNLLDNAVKHSPDHKSVRVEVTSVESKVEFRVIDRGIGIASRDLKNVFDKFYRGENASRLGMKGAGIGLTIVREIVRAHGGQVRVESAPGEGSVFTFVVPAEEKS